MFVSCGRVQRSRFSFTKLLFFAVFPERFVRDLFFLRWWLYCYSPIQFNSPDSNFTDYLTYLALQSCVTNWRVYAYHLHTFAARIRGICSALLLIIRDWLKCFSFTFFRTASYFLKYPKRSSISLDIAEIFKPILVSVLKSNLLTFHNTFQFHEKQKYCTTYETAC